MRRLLVLPILVLGPVRAAAGQDPLSSYWAQVRSAATVAQVNAAEQPASGRTTAEALRRIRIYELTGERSQGREARALLERTKVAEAEDRAWRLLALGIVDARGPDSRQVLDDDAHFYDPQSLASARSVRLLRRALDLRPDLTPAAVELAEWAWDRQDTTVAREAAGHLASAPPTAASKLAEARALLLTGDDDGAARAARDAASRGAEAGVASHLLAEALLQADSTREAGVAAYFAGAAAPGDAAAAEYGAALAPILTDGEAEAWATLEPARRREWLRRFWERRAAESAMPPAERMAAHFRRLEEARRFYPLEHPLRVLQVQAPFGVSVDSRAFSLSMRGLMLVRHGDATRLAFMEQCLGSTALASGPGGGGGIICPGPPGARLRLFQTAGRLASGDSYVPFREPLVFGYQLYAFRGAGDEPEIALSVGVPVAEAARLAHDGALDVDVSAALLVPDSGAVERADSLVRTRYIPVEGDGMLLFAATLPSPRTGAVDYRIAVGGPDRRVGGLARGTMDVPELNAPGLRLSDLVVATVEAAPNFRRGPAHVALAARRAYRTGESFDFFYEIYGLTEGRRYRTEIRLDRRPGSLADRLLGVLRGNRSVELRFDGVAAAPDRVYGIQELRRVATSDLRSGIYDVSVTITDLETGTTTTRTTTLELTSQPEG